MILKRTENMRACHLQRSVAAWNPLRFLRSEDNAEAIVAWELSQSPMYPDNISPELGVDERRSSSSSSSSASRAAGVSASYLWLRLVSRKKRRQ